MATQNVALAQVTTLRSPPASIDTAPDHDVPL
jgi:hypothetical protein